MLNSLNTPVEEASHSGGTLGPASVARFGPFELDLRSAELRKGGLRVRLQEQPFQILLMLLEHPGELVLREEIRKRLWPDSIVVEFDHSINAAVKRLRDALRDSAEKPRYIETLARRGYRFISEVKTTVEEPSREAPHQSIAPPLAAHHSADLKFKSGGVRPHLDGPFRHSRLWTLVTVLLVTTVLAWVGISRWKANSRAIPPPRTVPLTYYPGEELSPSFSPDGSQVAFSWNGLKQDNYDIYVKTVGSNATPVRMTTDPAQDTRPSWSPDGRYIAFVREHGESDNAHGDLMILPLHLDAPERKLATVEILQHPRGVLWRDRLSWSPDSSAVASSARVSGNDPNGISEISVDSGTQRRLTTAPSSTTVDCCPAFSPDGKSLAFWRGSGPSGELLVDALGPTGAPTGSPHRLAVVNSLWSLDWTPDGKELLYSALMDDGWPLFRIPASGGTPLRVLEIAQAHSLAVARRGNRLAWSAEEGHRSIYRLDLASGAISKFASSTRFDYAPQFSPDGRRVAFTSDRSGTLEIWICDSQGSRCFPVTEEGGTLVGSPRWSPDGKQIAFDSARNGPYEIFVVSAQGGSARVFARGPASNARPSWSRDGRWIYFGSNRTGIRQVWKMPTGGGPEVQITRHGGFEAVESMDGTMLYYAKRDAPGIWSVPVGGGLEQLVTSRGEEGNWAVVSAGIYLYRSQLPDLRSVDYFDFATRRVQRIAELPKGPRTYLLSTSFALSPDRRTALYVQLDATGEDIMLTENFR